MKKLLILLGLLCALNAQAASTIFKQSVEAPMPKTYGLLYDALEKQRLFVVFEPNIGRNLAGMAKRLGDNYNRNQLAGIRSLVVCNAWYANEVSNLDPDMLALCPLRVTVTHKDGVTHMLFARPSVHAQGSAALPVIQEVEQLVVEAMQQAARQAAP